MRLLQLGVSVCLLPLDDEGAFDPGAETTLDVSEPLGFAEVTESDYFPEMSELSDEVRDDDSSFTRLK